MKQPAGYCKLKRMALSIQKIKEKGCMDPKKQHGNKTQCVWLRKYPDHPYWVKKAILKEFRRAGML